MEDASTLRQVNAIYERLVLCLVALDEIKTELDVTKEDLVSANACIIRMQERIEALENKPDFSRPLALSTPPSPTQSITLPRQTPPPRPDSAPAIIEAQDNARGVERVDHGRVVTRGTDETEEAFWARVDELCAKVQDDEALPARVHAARLAHFERDEDRHQGLSDSMG